jgi:hypothetical protein
MSEDNLTPTEMDLIRRVSKSCLITFAFIALATKQNYFDYPVTALSFAIFCISLLHSTVIFSRFAIGFLLILTIVPPQAAPLFKESISFLTSIVHG